MNTTPSFATNCSTNTPVRIAFIVLTTTIIGREFNFAMMEADTKNLPYDYGSIMHYDLNAFSSNGKPTMSVLFPTKEKVGQRNGLSKFDWQWLDKVYCTGE